MSGLHAPGGSSVRDVSTMTPQADQGQAGRGRTLGVARTRESTLPGGVTPVRLPERRLTPVASIVVRLGVAVGCLLVSTAVVYAGRAGYRDNGTGEPLDLLAALYYSTVSLSTTGYGDITPVSDAARWVNILLITPLRFLFLIVLVGTTIEVLTQRSRQEFRVNRWRRGVRDHTIVIGYGVKGQTTVETLIENGEAPERIVVVAEGEQECDEAGRKGIVAVRGDARREEVLRTAGVETASRVVVAADRDDTSMLITLTTRRLNPGARIVAAARESENADLLRQSGADAVIMTAESAGRMLGLSLVSANAGALMEDLLDPGRGLEVVERAITREELGIAPVELRERGEIVLAVVRDGEVMRFDERRVKVLQTGDRVVVIRVAPELPSAVGPTRNPAAPASPAPPVAQG